MRPEEFDHRLNQKLQDINPVFNEKDWNRFRLKFDHATSGRSNKKNKLKYLLLFLLLLVFISILNPWRSFKTNATESNNNVGAKMARVTEFNTEDKAEGNRTKMDYDLQNKNNPTSYTNNQNSAYKTHKLKNSLTEKNHSKTFSNNIKSNPTKEGTQNPMTFSSDPVLETTTIADLDVNNGLLRPNNNNSHEIADQIISKNTDVEKSFEMVSQQPFTILQVETLTPENIQSIHPFSKTKIKPIRGIKPNRIIAGILALQSKNHFSSGVAFEIKTNKNISFSSGVIYQNYFEKSFLNENEYSTETSEEFSKLIKPRYSRSSEFSNIRIQSKDWLLPLQLKYYLPFNTRYSAFLTGGIQLTLKSNTLIDFNYIPDNSSTVNHLDDFDQASNSSTFINHFVLGLGMQRDFRNLLLQTSVVLQKNNTNLALIPKKEVGLQIGLFYKL